MTITEDRWIIDTEKRLGSEFWSNVYQVVHTSLATASAFALTLTAAEAEFHSAAVLFTRTRVRSWDPADDTYVILPVNSPGARTPVTSLLPLFNTLRMDFTAASGRPSRKYYRGVLHEGDINGDLVEFDFSAGAAAIEALFATSGAANGIVDPQLQLLTDAVVHPFVQMRQLRRSRRRRTNGAGIFQ